MKAKHISLTCCLVWDKQTLYHTSCGVNSAHMQGYLVSSAGIVVSLWSVQKGRAVLEFRGHEDRWVQELSLGTPVPIATAV